MNCRKHLTYFIYRQFIRQYNWTCEIWGSHSSVERDSSLLGCFGLLDIDDGRTKILRNVDNYQSSRRNVSENSNLNFYLLLLPFRNAFEVYQFLERILYCFYVILCCILVTRPERTTSTRFSAFCCYTNLITNG